MYLVPSVAVQAVEMVSIEFSPGPAVAPSSLAEKESMGGFDETSGVVAIPLIDGDSPVYVVETANVVDPPCGIVTCSVESMAVTEIGVEAFTYPISPGPKAVNHTRLSRPGSIHHERGAHGLEQKLEFVGVVGIVYSTRIPSLGLYRPILPAMCSENQISPCESIEIAFGRLNGQPSAQYPVGRRVHSPLEGSKLPNSLPSWIVNQTISFLETTVWTRP